MSIAPAGAAERVPFVMIDQGFRSGIRERTFLIIKIDGDGMVFLKSGLRSYISWLLGHLLVAAVGILLITPFSFAQTVSFEVTPRVPVPGTTYMVAGDFNNDGKLDLVTATNSFNYVSIFIGDGTGGFGPARNFSVGVFPEFVAVADFNGDAKLDLVVVNHYSDNVSILLGDGTGSFGSPTNYAVGSPFPYVHPTSVAVGDLNGDSILDLAVTNEESNEVSILLGKGDGSFTAAQNFPLGSEYRMRSPQVVAIGEFNGDGKPDLVVANRDSSELSILLGDGTGSFGPARNLALPGSPVSVALGDFNSDGKMDLAVSVPHVYVPLPQYIANGYVAIFLGDGTGQFVLAGTVSAGLAPARLFVADFNGDAIPDLAVLNYTTIDVSILLGDGAGSFSAATNYAVGLYPYAAALGDFNGDGKVDIAVSNAWSDYSSVLIGTGTGSFKAGRSFFVGSTPVFVAAADLDADGILDLVVTNHDTGNIAVLRGNGAGSFGAARTFAVGKGPVSVTTGDFDGDGEIDLVVTNEFSNTVSVLLGDGKGSFNSLRNFLVGTNPVAVEVADLNADGKLDLVVANAFSGSISILLGDGTGSFAVARNFTMGGLPVALAVGDVNGDGKPDLVVGGRFDPSLTLLLGDGMGGIAAAGQINLIDKVEAVRMADINKDGRLDLVVAGSASNSVWILLGKGTGSFGRPKSFAVGEYPFSLGIEDFNQDGNLDIAVANLFGDSVSILSGDGAGSFGAAQNFDLRRLPAALAVGDFNSDGMPDIVVPNVDNYVVTVALNTTTTTTPLTLLGPYSFEAEVHVPYVGSLLISGGTPLYTVAIAAGALPSGLNLIGQSISGTPTLAGRKNFTVRVVDHADLSATKRYTLKIFPELKVGTATLAPGRVGRTYKKALKAQGGKAPFSWSVLSGSLPPGLNLNPSTGQITGTPTSSGTFDANFQLTDPLGGQAQRTLNLKVN